MVSVALKISDEFKNKINELPWVNWSELGREEAMLQEAKLELLDKLEKAAKDSTLTDEDILEMVKKSRKGRFNKLKAMGLV